MNKIKEVVAITGEYTNQHGEVKKRYLNVGSLMEKDGNQFILLSRTFNPAGIPNPENRDTVLLSFFEPKQKDQPAPQQSQQTNNDLDDAIPF